LNKRFVTIFLVIVFSFAIFHFVIWTFITSKCVLNSDTKYKGDLVRFSYKADSLFLRKTTNVPSHITLAKQHTRVNKWNESLDVDLITLGDSFSNADTQGTNPYYQDYIVSNQSKSVLNVPPSLFVNDTNSFETLITYINNGLLDIIKPKYILIESVERLSISRFAKKFDFSLTDDKNVTIENFKNYQQPLFKANNNINFINERNTKVFVNYVKFNLQKYAKFNNVFISKLNQDFFTSKDTNSLLFYQQDLSSIPLTTKKSIKELNDNFNKLAMLLKKKGINLYFMPAVDKYNLYSKYIMNNSHPKSIFFEELRKLPKKYAFIDTKAILSKELEKGVKDLYYSDDTHWSYKASEAIFKKVKFE